MAQYNLPPDIAAYIAGLNQRLSNLERLLGGTGWVELKLENSWTKSGAPFAEEAPACLQVGAVVRLRGTIWGGSSGSQAFILPVGCRPLGRVELVGALANMVGFHLVIAPTGAAQVYFAEGTACALDGLTFPTN